MNKLHVDWLTYEQLKIFYILVFWLIKNGLDCLIYDVEKIPFNTSKQLLFDIKLSSTSKPTLFITSVFVNV